MEITLPIRRISQRPTTRNEATSRLENNDYQEWFDLQFTPREIQPSTDYNWTEDEWRGSDRVHRQFLGTGQTHFELVTEFLVDPGAPYCKSTTDPPIGYRDKVKNALISIENVIEVIERWQAIYERHGRPAIINVVLPGGRVYSGVITRFSWRAEERFHSGIIRRATIYVGFGQWRRIV